MSFFESNLGTHGHFEVFDGSKLKSFLSARGADYFDNPSADMNLFTLNLNWFKSYDRKHKNVKNANNAIIITFASVFLQN